MGNRWLILFVLFAVRTTTGIQYQSVASVSSFLMGDLGIDYSRFGLLIGLYQLPGVAIALPGGLLAKRIGDKLVVIGALTLMMIGGLMMGLNNSYTMIAAGRLLSGAGVVLLDVILTKIIADWFAGREIVVAMAILVSSWPFGIAIGLISLAPLAMISSWQLVMLLIAGLCFVNLVLVVAFYRTPPSIVSEQTGKLSGPMLSWKEVWLVVLAGLIWTLFNVGFVVLPSFAPEFLSSTGYTLAAAGVLVSILTWIIIPSIQLGGWAAERIKRPDLIMVVCFCGIGALMCLLPYFLYPLALFIFLGLLFGPPVGIIMSLPAEVLRPENRAPGMGIFFSCYYGGVALLTGLAGFTRDLINNPAAPILFGGMLFFITILILGLFRSFQKRMLGKVT